MSPRPTAARFDSVLARVKYVTRECQAGQCGGCGAGPDAPRVRNRAALPCSHECHAAELAAALAYMSSACQRGDHADCPSLRGELFAEEPGRPELIAVPCTCEVCHGAD